MLTSLDCGWTTFQLDGTSEYVLSFLDYIPFDWVDQAIHGLETMLPFCVKGFQEPDRFICTVSYWNCHIVSEYDEREPLERDDVKNELSHTSMLQFCQYLYDDISADIEALACFDYIEFDETERIDALKQKLSCFKELIEKRKGCFDEGYFFL